MCLFEDAAMTYFLAGLLAGTLITLALCIRWAWRAMEPHA